MAFKTVWLIDDDGPTNILNTILIQDSGFSQDVVTYTDAREALEVLIEGKNLPELLFLDINMPRMNGWEFLEALQEASLEKVPIILMLSTSLNPSDQDRAEADELIDSFIKKPLSFAQLDGLKESLRRPE